MRSLDCGVEAEILYCSLDDFSKVTCDLALFLLESSSEFNCGSFDIFWDLGRRLIIAGQE